jgi:uncharacterized protein (TIGR03067 family)
VRRVVLSLLAVLTLTAFAPAPFPKAQRGARQDEITIKTLQGTWRAASMKRTRRDGNHTPSEWSTTHIHVENDKWAFMQNGNPTASYTITITNGRKPAALDFYYGAPTPNERAPGEGIIRRRGDVVEILYSFAAPRRAVSFEQPPDNQCLLTLQKER